MSSSPAVTDGARDGAQSVRRAIAVLRIVAGGQEGGVRLIDVSMATGLNRTRRIACCAPWLEEGWWGGAGCGPAVSLVGLARPTGFPLRAIAAPHLRHLGETLNIAALLKSCHAALMVALHSSSEALSVKVRLI